VTAPAIFIAGPCSIESVEVARSAASALRSTFEGRPGLRWVFKGSFLKDNRTSARSYRGPGISEGLEVLAAIRGEYGIEVTTDIHEPSQAAPAAEVVDVLQIPAFMCRQTSLLEAAGETRRIVNVKKGQFMDPAAMRGAVDKLKSRGCPEVWITERGTFFGYGDLVVDFRSLSVLRGFADRVFVDVTHSLQKPSAAGDCSGGCRMHAIPLARAAAAWGVDGLFFEVHPDPASALSDSETMLDFGTARELVDSALRHWEGPGS
jgi:2-dehydro-3-deoxyphosphooctonate aldolase (KDO 8-P synthase)